MWPGVAWCFDWVETTSSHSRSGLSAYQAAFRTQCVSFWAFVVFVWQWGRLRCASCLSRFTERLYQLRRMLNKAIWSPDQLSLLLVFLFFSFFQILFNSFLFIFSTLFFFRYHYFLLSHFCIKSWDTERISGAFLLAGTMIYHCWQLCSHDRLALIRSHSDERERWIVFNFLKHLRRFQLQQVLFALEVSRFVFSLSRKTSVCLILFF